MTTALQIAKNTNVGYVAVYLKRRAADGTYDTDWMDVTTYVAGGANTIEQALDSQDFDVGIAQIGNMTLQFNNQTGRFAEPWDCRSLWAAYETRHLSKIKVEAGYLDDDGAKIVEVAFNGLIEDRGTSTSDGDNVTVMVLSRESVLGLVTVPAGSLSSGTLASVVIYNLCSRGEIVEHLTIDAANINPENDIIIDDPTDFDGKKLNDVLSGLMLLTNSVLYINQDGELIVSGRTHSRRVKWELRKRAANGLPDNIYALTNYNTGRKRVKNHWQWSSSTLVAKSSDHDLQKFGVTKKTVSGDSITNAVTKQAILDRLRDEWQYPKRELEVTTDYLANEVTFFDTVTCDIQPTLGGTTEFPVAGSCLADGTVVCPIFVSGLHIEPLIGFKILSIKHDLAGFKTTLKIREIGNKLHDGYLMNPLTAGIDVEFTAVASVDIDIGAYSMNAQYCKVEVTDIDTDYQTTVGIGITRPNTTTIRLTAGGTITASFRVLVTEVEAV